MGVVLTNFGAEISKFSRLYRNSRFSNNFSTDFSTGGCGFPHYRKARPAAWLVGLAEGEERHILFGAGAAYGRHGRAGGMQYGGLPSVPSLSLPSWAVPPQRMSVFPAMKTSGPFVVPVGRGRRSTQERRRDAGTVHGCTQMYTSVHAEPAEVSESETPYHRFAVSGRAAEQGKTPHTAPPVRRRARSTEWPLQGIVTILQLMCYFLLLSVTIASIRKKAKENRKNQRKKK